MFVDELDRLEKQQFKYDGGYLCDRPKGPSVSRTEYWRQYKREQRALQTPEQKADINFKRRIKYRDRSYAPKGN